MSNRNIAKYTEKYKQLPFEHIQLLYRRNCVLKEIEKINPSSLLEIGCGERPLFIDYPPSIGITHTVVEPSIEFVERATCLADGRSDVHIIQSVIEEFDTHDVEFDMVIVSCVLHEVVDPQAFLSSIHRLCGLKTFVHINVPNARSFHRLLAVAMGIIPHEAVQSETQLLMQQRATVYDLVSLQKELKDAGFCIIDSGSLFVKPFTHLQMQKLVDDGFMTAKMLDGLDKMVNYYPELGSEIWVNAQCSTKSNDDKLN